MEKDVIDFRRQVRAVKNGRWIYAAALALLLGLGVFYFFSYSPKYDITSRLLIEDDEDGGGVRSAGSMSSIMRTFSVGGFGAASIDNELLIADTRDVMKRMVKTLGLNRIYAKKEGIIKKKSLWQDSPVTLEAPDEYFDTLPMPYVVNVKLSKGVADIVVKKAGYLGGTVMTKDKQTLPCELNTPYGVIQLVRSPQYTGNEECEIMINVGSNDFVADYYQRQVEISQLAKKADVIEFNTKDDNRERGKAIVNGVMDAYNEKRIERKHELAKEEFDFYTNRIDVLMNELNDVEGKLEQFKRSKDVANPGMEAAAYLEQSMRIQKIADSVRNEIKLQEIVLRSIEGVGGNDFIPNIEGMSDPNISLYNNYVTQKRELERSAKPGNVALTEINAKIDATRKAIIQNAQRRIANATSRANLISSQANKALGKFEQMPGYEREYIGLMRDQALKNELYIFLLQKKESSLLKLTSQTTPSFVVEKAYSSIKPKKTKAFIVLFLCLLMGLLLPTLWVLWRMKSKDKLLEPCDLPAEMEQNSLIIDDENDSKDINEIRSLLMMRHDVKQLFISQDSLPDDSRFAQNITDSLNDIGHTTRLVKVGGVNDLYVGENADEIKSALSHDENAIIVLPDDTRVEEIKDLLDERSLFMVVTNGGAMKRKAFVSKFSSLLEGGINYFVVILRQM